MWCVQGPEGNLSEGPERCMMKKYKQDLKDLTPACRLIEKAGKRLRNSLSVSSPLFNK